MPRAADYLCPLMFSALPEVVDAWRMVAGGRVFQGSMPLSAMPRLAESLADTQGECKYEVEFGKDEFGIAFVAIRASAELPLTCQRTLERFALPVQVDQVMGLIRDEREEASLPPGYEPVLVPEDGRMNAAELVEDEMILAVPVVPVKPGTEAVEAHWPAVEAEPEEERPNPFAALSALKKQQ
jgi:uncharacterized protein